MKGLLENTEQAKEMALKAHEKVLEKNSAETMVNSLDKLYKELFGGCE